MYFKTSERPLIQLLMAFNNLSFSQIFFFFALLFFLNQNETPAAMLKLPGTHFWSVCFKDHTIVFEQWKLHRNTAVTPGATSATASHSTGFIQVLYI